MVIIFFPIPYEPTVRLASIRAISHSDPEQCPVMLPIGEAGLLRVSSLLTAESAR